MGKFPGPQGSGLWMESRVPRAHAAIIPPVTLNDFPLPGSNQPPPYSAGINHNRSITYIGVEHGIDLLGLGELAEVPVPVQKGLGTVQDLHVAFTDWWSDPSLIQPRGNLRCLVADWKLQVWERKSSKQTWEGDWWLKNRFWRLRRGDAG